MFCQLAVYSVLPYFTISCNFCILSADIRAGASGSLPGGSVISRLLINADPFNSEPENLDYYVEKCVMNNYFGIGLDAKISLDFNNKRDEHPEKCSPPFLETVVESLTHPPPRVVSSDSESKGEIREEVPVPAHGPSILHRDHATLGTKAESSLLDPKTEKILQENPTWFMIP
ncbi:hypothetical protein JD844_007072 [Phrynosoma platyrhinos]|uniref:Diacylglycerol kinase accessory domain-containing protein n=1 Tax=Phrynosoma platyrhinos TaxID=52577 RepID=A0ABQ7T2Q7_PHRPL|nr:hypothetical protein JD844_007072 [Phrynosoma platyrhinos]